MQQLPNIPENELSEENIVTIIIKMKIEDQSKFEALSDAVSAIHDEGGSCSVDTLLDLYHSKAQLKGIDNER